MHQVELVNWFAELFFSQQLMLEVYLLIMIANQQITANEERKKKPTD